LGFVLSHPFAKNANGWGTQATRHPGFVRRLRSLCWSGFFSWREDAQALDAAACGGDDLDLHAGGFKQDDFAGERDAAFDFADQAAERGGFVSLVETSQAVLLAK